MLRQEIEAAIAELDDLLAADEESEQEYQSWFENHDVVFVALGYSRYIPHPRLGEDGELYVPDFVAQRPNGAWDILEIKTPQAAILRDRERRSKFYAEFESYVSQCAEYSESLDDAAIRSLASAKYDIVLQKRPRTLLIAGRSEGLNLSKLYDLCSRRTPALEVLTFDDILRQLETFRIHGFGKYDRALGFSLSANLVIHKSDNAFTNNHLFDVGVHRERDRVSLFINPQGFLRMTIWSSTGVRTEAKSRSPLALEDYDRPIWIHFEVGATPEFGFASIQLDAAYQADLRIGPLDFVVSDQFVVGSDWSGTASSWFSMDGFTTATKPASFEEKLALRRDAVEWRDARLASNEYLWAVFRGHKFLYSTGHPLATAHEDGGTARGS